MLKPGAKDIVFDWEHTEYAFIDPKALSEWDTVPNLEFGLKRCLVGPDTERALNLLREDHESGAQALAMSALDFLLQISRGNDLAHVGTVEEFWKELRFAAWHLAKNGRPSMGSAIEAAVFKALDLIKLDSTTKNNHGSTDGELLAFKHSAESTLKQSLSERKSGSSIEVLSQHFVDYVESEIKLKEASDDYPITIVTLSASGTIKQCLVQLIRGLGASKRDIKLIILESRPNFEGAAFATDLLDTLERSQDNGDGHAASLNSLRSRLHIDIIPDASVAIAVKPTQYLLLGADKVIPSGDTSNKIGSLAAALIAKTINPSCKVVAVFETGKITSGNAAHSIVEYNDEMEVIKSWPCKTYALIAEKRNDGYKINVKNNYFEWVPAKYIDNYISEQGILSVEEIRRLSKETEELEQRLFNGI